MTQDSTGTELSAVDRHSLAAFDFAFNGALDAAQVHELATAAFVGRGENLLLVGGPGTGKTVIADAVHKEAIKRGLTCENLHSAWSDLAGDELIAPGPGYIGFNGEPRGLRRHLLDCDLLIIDEIGSWLHAAPSAVLMLIGRRIELGKSNILLASSLQWNRLQRDEESLKGDRQNLALPSFRLAYPQGKASREHSEWARLMSADGTTDMRRLLATLGIDLNLPMAAEEPSATKAVQGYEPSPFARRPVWHTLYTGENSYRHFPA